MDTPREKEPNLVSEALKKLPKPWSEEAVILAEYSAIDSSHWKFGLMQSLENDKFASAIQKLSATAEVDNPFFNTDFLAAASKNLANGNVQYLFLVEIIGGEENLHFFAPVVEERIGLFGTKALKLWSHDYAPLGEPLYRFNDPSRARDALDHCLETAEHPEFKTILLEFQRSNSEFQKLLTNSMALSETFVLFDEHERPALFPTNPQNYSQKYVTGKRRQRLRKARERLSAMGEISFKQFTDASELPGAIEEFLALEHSGWKGNRGTSLSTKENERQFTLDAIMDMAANQNASVFVMYLNDKPVSSLVLFKANRTYFPWKMSYDETLGKYSVGNLLLVHVNDWISEQDDYELLDSLAARNNVNALRYWPDRLKINSMVLDFGKGAGSQARRLAAHKIRMIKLKQFAKRLLRRN